MFALLIQLYRIWFHVSLDIEYYFNCTQSILWQSVDVPAPYQNPVDFHIKTCGMLQFFDVMSYCELTSYTMWL